MVVFRSQVGNHQVGVPCSIAINLTVLECVIHFNLKQLSQLTSNGPTEHHVAKCIIWYDGTHVELCFVKKKMDLILSNG